MGKDNFIDKHREPKTITLDLDMEVLNLPRTSNRKPNGDFGRSWTQYWLAFSGEQRLCCSVCGIPLWNNEAEKSKGICMDLVRQHEINNSVENKDDKMSLEDFESQGGHVKLDGIIYITPLCPKHNKEKEGELITLQSGSVLVEEVDPIIENEN